MEEITLNFAVFVGITMGLVQVVKRFAPSLERFYPTFALVFGIALNMSQGLTVENGIIGIVIGLSAVGLFSGGRKTLS